MRMLSAQLQPSPVRVLYTASGTRQSAAKIVSDTVLIERAAYWAAAQSSGEADDLTAILNSAVVLAKVSDLQPRGEVGARRFDNLVWTLPIPEYGPAEALHRDLAAAAARAGAVAATVDISAGLFTAKRRAIRAMLDEDGVAQEIETLVDALLPV